jgi:hydroxylamine reductase (hybrid-cluster protein)
VHKLGGIQHFLSLCCSGSAAAHHKLGKMPGITWLLATSSFVSITTIPNLIYKFSLGLELDVNTLPSLYEKQES